MSGPSTKTPNFLPAPSDLERISQSLATLDALLAPDWEERWFSHNRVWDEAAKWRVGSMRKPTGDEVFILFSPAGTILKGNAQKTVALNKPTPALLEGVPEALSAFLKDESFELPHTTFCLWNTGAGWKHGTLTGKEDGSTELLKLYAGNAQDYRAFAQDFFGADVPLKSVQAVLKHLPLDEKLAASINPEIDLGLLEEDLEEIGYPRGK